MDTKIKKKLVKNWFKVLQDIICKDIEELEGKKNIFKSKIWFRNKNKNEGGGEFRILENGKIFEKVGVNFSEVYGKLSKKFKKKIPGTNKNSNFWASGISVVMHMKNPHIPAMHFNTRYIYTSHGWFGGGMDITPCIKDNILKKWFHNELKKTCNKHNKNYYKKYKKWCDNYFYLPHRNEPRGIGVYFLTIKKIIGKKIFLLLEILELLLKIYPKILYLKKKRKNGQKNKKIFNILKEVDMLNLIYYMIELQNLDKKQVEMLRVY